MAFENLILERLITHEVFRRDENRAPVLPSHSNALIELTDDARAAISTRITEAMGRASQSVEMEIKKTDSSSMLSLGRDLLNADEANFIRLSKEVANKLTDAQTSRQIPGGLVVVMSGQVGYPGRRVLIVIKAEPQDGFARERRADGSIALQFLKELFLTPKATLYKIGAFVEADPASATGEEFALGFKAQIFDHGMTLKNRDDAAVYFYQGFLGCGFPLTAARQTKQFYHLTKEFINNLPITEEQKLELNSALFAYLKVNQARTIQTAEFSRTYLEDAEQRDAYVNYMRDKGVSEQAISKDLADVAPLLKLRRVRFRSNIRVTAPAEEFKKISIEVIDAPEGSETPQWTVLTIQDRIVGQE
jgi:hypothetical protein